MMHRTLVRALAVVATLTVHASAAAQSASVVGFEGEWEGTLAVAGLRIRMHVSRASDGLWIGEFDSVDQGAKLPMDHIVVAGDTIRYGIASVGGTYQGVLSAARDAITGSWSQGTTVGLNFTRSKAAPVAAAAAAPAAVPAPPAAEAPKVLPFGVPMQLEVPVPPTPVQGSGRTHLAYELHVTNLSTWQLQLRRVEVLGDRGMLASLEADDLNGVLGRPGAPGMTDKRSIAPGLRAVVYVWITLEAGAPAPTRLRHRVTVGDQSVEGATFALSTSKAVTIGAPLRGDNWLAANGPGNTSGHRRALIPVDGMGHIAQRFAIDWVRHGEDGRTYSGDRLVNKNYHAYGSEALAVADGVISETKDSILENVPGPTSRAVPITLETIGGNHVIINLGGGRFAFYAHLQPGSLRVRVGDRVTKGQVVGLVGNSGNSTEPHLHFHITNGNSPLGSDGLPYLLESFEVMSGAIAGVRRNEIPMENARVKFPAPK